MCIRDSEDIVLTPMMKQFLDLKAKHPDAVMLFRCGDFYETYSTAVSYTHLYSRPGESFAYTAAFGAIPEGFYLCYDTRHEVSSEFHPCLLYTS